MDTKALRQKILDLAIRGKLVPQDPNDEPASVLLERIRAEKQQMVKEGKLKAKDIKGDTIIFKGEDNLHYEKFTDATVKCIEDEIPFEVPEGWSWIRLCNICPYGESSTVTSTQIRGNAWILDLEDIEKDTGKILYYATKDERDSKSNKNSFKKGQLLYSKLRPYLNKVVIAPKDGYCTTEILPLTLYGGVSPYYMQIFLMSDTFLSYVNLISYGLKMPRLGTNDGKKALIAIPPLNEQSKIVEKLNYLIAIIDDLQLEKDILLETINHTKNKILDLAIRGKLVSQDPNDEPASVLLERIRAETEELIKQVKIKRDKRESIIFRGDDNSYYEKVGNKCETIDEIIPFEIPDTWTWCRGYTCFSGMESKKPTGAFFDYIDIDSIDNLNHKIKEPKHLPVSDAPSRASRAVQTGSVLFSLVRPYLENIALIEEKHANSIASTGFYICNPTGALYPEYMFFLMISRYVVSGLNQFMKGDNSPSISKDHIENWIYPIPPFEEQKVICQKIKVMFSEIDAIEKSLS